MTAFHLAQIRTAFYNALEFIWCHYNALRFGKRVLRGRKKLASDWIRCRSSWCWSWQMSQYHYMFWLCRQSQMRLLWRCSFEGTSAISMPSSGHFNEAAAAVRWLCPFFHSCLSRRISGLELVDCPLFIFVLGLLCQWHGYIQIFKCRILPRCVLW